MSDEFEYRPKLFDIRVKPPGKDKARKGERTCEWDGCVSKGMCKAPQSPDKITDYFYFCQRHAREYNKAWNFFHGMSEGAVRSYHDNIATGHRPTWNMHRNVRGQSRNTSGFADPFDLAKDAAFKQEAAPKRRLGRLQARAMDDLGLDHNCEGKMIRARYLKLVKQFHPDANKGDRSTEERLQQVIRAYQILKTAKLA